jgi:hypothetical protein
MTNDDALAGVVEPLGPVLRMDELAFEAIGSLEPGSEPLVVAVVATGAEQPLA